MATAVTGVKRAKQLAAKINPKVGWKANQPVLELIVETLVEPHKPMYKALTGVAQVSYMGSVQAAVYAFLASEDDLRGWDWARLDEPTEDMIYRVLAQAKVQHCLTGKLQMDRPTPAKG